ncbi:MAG: T9SS type A sorting domain-containing protein, partial [Patescibacteria group bacterium]|nr:T9SS type A sorting domain-containing protein [Patescibacteria group bacterium]
GEGNLYFGSEGGMFFSLDSQGAWRWSSSILGGSATSPAIGQDGTVYVAAGNRLFAFGSQATGVEDSHGQLALWVSPNPSSGQAQVKGYLPQSGRLSLAVYDLRGRLVLTLLDQDRLAGDFQAKLSDLPSGHYFVLGRINNQEQSAKITIVR